MKRSEWAGVALDSSRIRHGTDEVAVDAATEAATATATEAATATATEAAAEACVVAVRIVFETLAKTTTAAAAVMVMVQA